MRSTQTLVEIYNTRNLSSIENSIGDGEIWTPDLPSTSLMRYQLSCPDWIILSKVVNNAYVTHRYLEVISIILNLGCLVPLIRQVTVIDTMQFKWTRMPLIMTKKLFQELSKLGKMSYFRSKTFCSKMLNWQKNEKVFVNLKSNLALLSNESYNVLKSVFPQKMLN